VESNHRDQGIKTPVAPYRGADAGDPTPKVTTRLLIDVKGAAAMYGVSWRTFLRWADGGLVPWGLKIGGSRRFNIAELEEHIRGGCQPVRKVRPK